MIYLSRHAHDIFVSLHACAAGSRFVFPRRIGSTLLNEIGFSRDGIEKCLAHEDWRSSRSIYDKAEYAEQRRCMLRERPNMVDAWIDARPTYRSLSRKT